MGEASSKRVLVTGGAGFIGSHLVEHLIAGGHRVTVLDSLATGRLQNLASVSGHPQLSFHKVDVTNLNAIEPHFEGIDWVFHLAALADIVPSIQNPGAYFNANVAGTVCVLEAARKAGAKRFIYAASSSCYGIPTKYPTPEDHPIRPQYPYALTKYLGEECVLHWGQIYKMPVISLRLFNIYGPRSRTSGVYGAVFGVFLAQKLNGRPFTVVGDGTQTRDFLFIADAVRALIMAAQSDLANEVLNVSSGKTYSVNRIVELLKGEVVHIPKRPGEPDCTWADLSKIRRLLRWEPKVSFEEGVAILVKNIDYWRDAPVWTVESIAKATEDWFKYLPSPVLVNSPTA